MAEDRQHGPGGTGSQGNNSYHQQGGPGYRFDYGSGGPQYPPPAPPAPGKDRSGWGDWIAMGILFLLPSLITKIISVVWFVRKVTAMSRSRKDAFQSGVRRAAGQGEGAFVNMGRDVTGEFKNVRQKAAGENAARAQKSRTAGQTARRKPDDGWNVRSQWDAALSRAQAEAKGSRGLMIGGGVMAGIFGIGFLAALGELFGSLFLGLFFEEELVNALMLAALVAVGAGMLISGVNKRRRAERYASYLGYIGANREVSLANMAANFGVPVEKLCKDLRRMLAKGYLPTGYVDLAEGKLFLTEMGYRQPQQEEPAPESARRAETREDDILRQIRQVNDDIPDEIMSAKIDRIEEITRKILTYQKAHPDREAQLRSFLNYYLPTTLKILRAYAQLDAQGIEGENISAAKARIEGMMDQVVAGFEKQLDKLFQDEAMDITSDVEVLENMLKKDGLSGDNRIMGL